VISGLVFLLREINVSTKHTRQGMEVALDADAREPAARE
jgi:hypothetical protein